MSRILITGATGFVGSALCRELRSRNHLLSGTTRNPERGQTSDGTPLYVVPSLNAETDWRQAVNGADVVVHLAARTHQLGEGGKKFIDDYRAVNLEGSRTLADAARHAGVKHFIYLSTIKAAGERSDEHGLSETHTPAPEDSYGISKLEAEHAVKEAAGNDMITTVLRPPLVLGPNVGGNLLTLLDACYARRRLPLGATNNKRSLVSVNNLAHAIAECIERPDASSGVFHIADSQPLSTTQLIQSIGGAMSRPQRLFAAPKALMQLAGILTGRSGAIDRLYGTLVVDSSKFRDAMNWQPPLTVQDGIAQMAAWYLENHPEK